eukprot:8723492-Pyramimonas_sp.AAC.1
MPTVAQDRSSTRRVPRGLGAIRVSPPLRWASQEPKKMPTVAQLAAPPAGGREVSTRSACPPTPLGLPGTHESADSCA